MSEEKNIKKIGYGKMKYAVVTGGAGFIGSHLAEALVARGEEVVCLVRKTSKTDRLEPLRAEASPALISSPVPSRSRAPR